MWDEIGIRDEYPRRDSARGCGMKMETQCEKTIVGGNTVVLTERLPHLLTACIGFWINFGSRHEMEPHLGAAHFIEHMLFKGTETMDAKGLALAIETLGGSINAAASEERTYCYARVLPEHLPVAVGIIADMFGKSVFAPAEFDREKEVVLEEIKGHEDSPEELAFDLFLEDIYGRRGLGHSILGYEKTIRNISRDELYGLYKKFYRPAHLIVAVAGNIGDADVTTLVENALEPCTEPPCEILKPAPSPSDFAPRITLHHKKTAQVQFTLGAPGINFGHADRYVYMLLDVILSGGMSSRLFQEVREKRGLVYDISSINTCFSDSGFFGVTAGTRPDNLLEVLKVTADELKKLKDGDVTREELERVKQQLRVSMTMSFESVNARMMKIARSEIYYGRNMTDEEMFEMIHAVEMEDITRVSNELFVGGHTVFTALGPFRGHTKTLTPRISEILNAL